MTLYKAIFIGLVDLKAFHESLVNIGCKPGNNMTMDNKEKTCVEGDSLNVFVTWKGAKKTYRLDKVIGDSNGKPFAIRFGGNLVNAMHKNMTKIRKGAPMEEYYEKKDLEDFENIGEYAPILGQKYFDYYSDVMEVGKLSEREKSLIALTVAATQKCPYCIDAYTNKCLSLGISREEMMEAVHVGAAMTAGIVLAHSTQMRKIIKKKEM